MTAPLPGREAFATQVGSQFRAELPGPRHFELELVQLDENPAPAGQELYSLLFDAPPDAPVEQGIFRLEHPQLGALDLFLVPVSADARSVRYEAVVNRLSDPPVVRS